MAPVHDHRNSERAHLVRHWPSGCTPAGPGRACHELRVACTCTATSARAWLVSATCPSTPAVLRPVLRCVTCRTLTSVFDQLRSISFCRFLTLARSPSCDRLEDPAAAAAVPRSSCARQSTWSQASPSKPSSGPQVRSPKCPTCPSVPAFRVRFASKAHLPTSAPLSGPGTRPGIRPVIRDPSGRSPVMRPRFPAAFRPPAFASWAPCPARDSAPLTVGLPQHRAYPRTARTLAGFPRSARVRPGPGWALSLPRGRRCSPAIALIRGRRLPPLNGRSLFTPAPQPNPGCAT